MSKIRSEILYQRQIKEVNQADTNMRQLHIATPIADDDDFDDFDNEQNIEKEDLITVSDDDDANNMIIIIIRKKEKIMKWSQILKKMRINGMLLFLNGLKRLIMKIGLQIMMMNCCLVKILIIIFW
jgi:hypothetical protein